MLFTDKRHELKDTSQLLKSGFLNLKSLTLEHGAQYFLVSFSVKEGSARPGQTSLLGSEHDLANFCAVVANSSYHQIDDIAQLSRQAKGKENFWRLLRVHEVWTGKECESKYPTIRLIGANGKLIQNGPKPGNVVEKFTKIFPFA